MPRPNARSIAVRFRTMLRTTGALASARPCGISTASTFRMSTSVSKIVVGRCCVISSVGQTQSTSAARGRSAVHDLHSRRAFPQAYA